MDNRTRSQKYSDWVCTFCGSWSFIVCFATFTVLWLVFNSVQIMWKPWDKYPFIALNLVFTVVELFQGPLIMMSQNRQVERDSEAIHTILAEIRSLKKDQVFSNKGFPWS
jgi:uncharacterized membrane protein